jgi:hypothetical protein
MRKVLALTAAVGLVFGVSSLTANADTEIKAPEVIEHFDHEDHDHEDHDHDEREYSETDLEAAQSSWDKWDFKTFPKSTSVKQGDQFQVRAHKASAKHPVVIDWGDGTVEAYEQTKKICKTTKQARKNAKRCVIKVKHQYQELGTYVVKVTNPSKKNLKVISEVITVIPSGTNSSSGSVDNSVGVGGWWTPEPGSNSQRVWQAARLGATFAPCTTVQWYFDRSNEPNAAMYKQTPEALDIIAKHSGLTFVETQDPNAATLTFEWEEFTGGWANAAGLGGQRRDFRYDPNLNTSVETRTGAVRFNLLDDWTTSKDTTGFSPARVGNTIYTGSGWLIVHEAMHALGVDHSLVDGEVMSSIIDWDVDSMSSNDIDALNVMYLNNPCPAAA